MTIELIIVIAVLAGLLVTFGAAFWLKIRSRRQLLEFLLSSIEAALIECKRLGIKVNNQARICMASWYSHFEDEGNANSLWSWQTARYPSCKGLDESRLKEFYLNLPPDGIRGLAVAFPDVLGNPQSTGEFEELQGISWCYAQSIEELSAAISEYNSEASNWLGRVVTWMFGLPKQVEAPLAQPAALPTASNNGSQPSSNGNGAGSLQAETPMVG